MFASALIKHRMESPRFPLGLYRRRSKRNHNVYSIDAEIIILPNITKNHRIHMETVVLFSIYDRINSVDYLLENCGARRAAFRPYSPDLDPKSPVFMQVFGLPSLSKPTKSRNFWCSLTQPECCIHNAAQFLRFIMCSPPIYLHTQNPRTACHAKEPQSAQIIFV